MHRVVVAKDADAVVTWQADLEPQTTGGAIGGNASIAAVSTASRSTGRAFNALTVREFALGNQPPIWVLKSAGDSNRRPGEEQGLELAVDSLDPTLGLRVVGLELVDLLASAPVNSPTPATSLLRLPMPASLSQISRRGTAPSWVDRSDHMPDNRSEVVLVGIIWAVMNLENDAIMTSTGNTTSRPSTGIFGSGNRRSHWT